MILHSHSEHDTALIVDQFFPADFIGVYVDVGAGYPVYYSNSHHFREKGWQIIAIEPQRKMCDEFRVLGLPILEYACADTDVGETDFEILDYLGGLGGSAFEVLDPQPPGRAITKVKVQAFTLDTILRRHHPDLSRIDVLDIDVEYSELAVLKGFSVNEYSPTVVVIENLPRVQGWCNPFEEALHEYYSRIGYHIVARAAHNEILVKDE